VVVFLPSPSPNSPQLSHAICLHLESSPKNHLHSATSHQCHAHVPVAMKAMEKTADQQMMGVNWRVQG